MNEFACIAKIDKAKVNHAHSKASNKRRNQEGQKQSIAKAEEPNQWSHASVLHEEGSDYEGSEKHNTVEL